jgi:hypothetical protein
MILGLYSNCSNLAQGCKLYQDTRLTIPAPDAFYSDGDNCYTTVNGVITLVSPCTVPCDLVITGVTSTDPTTLGGTDGTITVTFTGTHGPFNYSIYQGAVRDPGTLIIGGVATSPQTITGLSANTTYHVDIVDANNCTASATATLGQSATRFDADWIMVTYQFTNGSDLDTRSRIALPNIGQDLQGEYLGWTYLGAFEPSVTYSSAATIDPTQHTISWGGDNTGTGYESVILNVARFKSLHPGETSVTLDLRAFWYSTLGTNPVIAAVTLWKGGTPIHDGCKVGATAYCWTNPTKVYEGTIDSVPTTITAIRPAGQASGQRVATLKYDLTTFVAVLNNNDTTTPSV